MVPRQAMRTRLRSRPRGLPRPLVIAIHGGAVAAIALEINRLSNGITAAGAFMVAIFAGAVTVGLVFAACVEPADSMRLPRRTSSRGAKCGACRRQMVDLHSIWICPTCDRIPTEP
jgi:hypothetical protein